MELILQGIGSRHNSEGQDNDQPDYDSVASDEDPVQEATCGDSGNDGRTKVRIDALALSGPRLHEYGFLWKRTHAKTRKTSTTTNRKLNTLN